MWRRLYQFWRPARSATIAGLTLLALAGALELMLPWPIKWLVDSVFGAQAMQAWMQSLWPADKGRQVLFVAAAVLALGMSHKLMFMISHYLLIRAGLKLARGIRCASVDHLQRLSLRYHDRAKVGDLVYRSLYDSYAAQAMLSQVVAPIFSGVLVLGGIIIVMARVDLWLTAIAAAAIPAIALTVWAFGRVLERRSKAHHERESGLFGALQEALLSIRAIQAFTQESTVSRRVGAQACGSELSNRRLALAQLGFSACVGVIMALCTALAVYAGAQRVASGRLLVGDVLVFLAYLGMLYTPISSFAQSSGLLQTVRTQLRRVFEILDAEPDVHDRPSAKPLATVRGEIELRSVRFEYEPARPVLRGIDMKVEPGKVIAIVGRTGSGKSTLASLLMRFYDVTGGAIALDGVDLRDLPLAWLRRQVTFVMQDPVLLAGTIAENIAFGRAEATPQQIREAARLARAQEFIEQLPGGYDTMLGERGVNLSGGQRQRIGIARGFLRDTRVVIFDEPTSAVDAHTEAELVASIRALARQRTTFIIAHRLTTVRMADEIWVMNDGQIAERGRHDELMLRDTLYRRLYSGQHRAAGGRDEDESEQLWSNEDLQRVTV